MNILEKLGCTPGPWHYNLAAGICPGNQPTRRRVALVAGHQDITEEDKYEGNGRLIASAPEMLEALIAGILANEKNGRPVESMYGAVEKATGKSWAEIKEMME